MTKAEDYRRRADESERAAGRTYNVVEYAELLERAKQWRALAEAAVREEDSGRSPVQPSGRAP